MSEEITNPTVKLASAAFIGMAPGMSLSNPWSPDDVDKLDNAGVEDYRKLLKASRFFYRHDPIVSSVFNKMVDICITELVIRKSKLSANEFRILNAIKEELEDFAENMALEYLISGLVVPEVRYARATKDQLKEFGIKKYETLTLPVSMWLRDPSTIKINSVFGDPSFFVTIPEKLLFFIQHEGAYPDGTQDKKLYQEFLVLYPDFVARVKNGEKDILLENNLIFLRRPVSDSPYPVPVLSPAVESLKHKRNLRRMDYSIASRVISAIQLFKLGNDEYPITEEQGDAFEAIKDQMYWRGSGGRDVEKVFQLFANHTLDVQWIFPDVNALLDEKKYANVNQDIIISLGFPRTLIVGENERSNSGDSEISIISPMRTMEQIRKRVLRVLTSVVNEIMAQNNLKGTAEIHFKPMNLARFTELVSALRELYDTGNLSRTSYAEYLGYNFEDEVDQRSADEELLRSKGLGGFAPKPFSNEPTDPSTPVKDKEDTQIKEDNKDKSDKVDNSDDVKS